MVVTNYPKSSRHLENLVNLKSIESMMEAAMEFSEVYAKNATTDEEKVCHAYVRDLNLGPQKNTLIYRTSIVLQPRIS